MKKLLFLFSILAFCKFSIAQNEPDLFIGTWSVDSTNFSNTVFLNEEMIAGLMSLSETMTAEEFYEATGFPMPLSPEEWDYISVYGITVPFEEEVEISHVIVSENQIVIYDSNEPIVLNYTYLNDSTISVTSVEKDFPFTTFSIDELSDSYMTISSTGTYFEDGMETIMNIIIYCSSTTDVISGCTDEDAINYNPEASIDDGSCEYGFMCSSNELQLTMYDEAEDGWEGTELVINGVAYTLADGEMGVECVELTDCYMFSTVFGEFMFEAYWELSDDDGMIHYSGSLPYDANDEDEDLVCDGIDNCTNLYNPDQLDTDFDGEGDACDFDDGLTISELNQKEGVLVKMLDVLGREQMIHEKGKLLFYLFEDGTVKKILR